MHTEKYKVANIDFEKEFSFLDNVKMENFDGDLDRMSTNLDKKFKAEDNYGKMGS